ncbi:uncharacterized protein N7479_000891 [Penicillium vulpinum]|uniref:Uncharacterized protein n=1 Tax=Penicillium vulpinum TaxID=29845 RepID=A0A1V6S6J1_9EURO|nr:uncharacterized protein N7479_000891 [Penicillium vulpinum]KAJ5970973.1 hypothetical protein N7479_000891 [Penicillium vulpinum]OQE09354.1 hypothetical protein PENVUL_c006G02239 [Penicillium vulpinum]
MASAGLPRNGGSSLNKLGNSHERDPAKGEACHFCKNGSHHNLEFPLGILFGLRNGPVTFWRRAAAEEAQLRVQNPYPQPGDAPVYRPQMPLVPRALRWMNSALPLLVPDAANNIPIIDSTTSGVSTEKTRVKSEDLNRANDSTKHIAT